MKYTKQLFPSITNGLLQPVKLVREETSCISILLGAHVRKLSGRKILGCSTRIWLSSTWLVRVGAKKSELTLLCWEIKDGGQFPIISRLLNVTRALASMYQLDCYMAILGARGSLCRSCDRGWYCQWYCLYDFSWWMSRYRQSCKRYARGRGQSYENILGSILWESSENDQSCWTTWGFERGWLGSESVFCPLGSVSKQTTYG